MNPNEKYIRISMGKILLNEIKELKLGDDVQILLQGEVTKVENLDNQDGTYDVVYVVKGVEAYTVNGEEVN